MLPIPPLYPLWSLVRCYCWPCRQRTHCWIPSPISSAPRTPPPFLSGPLSFQWPCTAFRALMCLGCLDLTVVPSCGVIAAHTGRPISVLRRPLVWLRHSHLPAKLSGLSCPNSSLKPLLVFFNPSILFPSAFSIPAMFWQFFCAPSSRQFHFPGYCPGMVSLSLDLPLSPSPVFSASRSASVHAGLIMERPASFFAWVVRGGTFFVDVGVYTRGPAFLQVRMGPKSFPAVVLFSPFWSLVCTSNFSHTTMNGESAAAPKIWGLFLHTVCRVLVRYCVFFANHKRFCDSFSCVWDFLKYSLAINPIFSIAPYYYLCFLAHFYIECSGVLYSS